MGIIESNYNFTYDDNLSFSENFSIWSQLNHEERSSWNEQPYTATEQKEVFLKLYTNKA